MIFFAAEITAARPGSATVTIEEGWGVAPWGPLAQLADNVAASTTILASDTGYRTKPTDPGGPLPYPPYISQAFAVSRAFNLSPGSSSVAAAWGSLVLSNPDGAFDALAASWNNDGRAVKILFGTKTIDATRGIFLDPAYATLVSAFSGVMAPWFLTDTQLQIPLRDATYWLEKPVQSAQYLGTGTYEGTASLLGVTKPKTRGTVFNVSPVLIDPANLIYQYTDGPGTVITLYEGAAANHTFQADTTNLYAGSTTAGNYRTDNSRGLLQLGSSPVAAITMDATGSFPIAGLKSVAATIALFLLAEDLAVPAANIGTSYFTACAASFPYAAGVYFPAGDTSSGVVAIDRLLSAFGAKLYPGRDGTLRVYALRAPAGTPVATLTTANAVSCTPSPLPSTLSPPPYRIRVAYAHNNTVQPSGLLGAATAARIQYVAGTDMYAGAVASSILTDYARPNDPAPIGGALAAQANAQAVATDLTALWGTRRRLYSVVVPLSVGLARDIGDVVALRWPLDDLPGGKIGIIVGDTFASNDATITLMVLI